MPPPPRVKKAAAKIAGAVAPPVPPPPPVNMAFAPDPASTRVFNDRDKALVKSFPKFYGNAGDDVDEWWRAFQTLDAHVWWPVPPAAGAGGNLAGPPLLAAQEETKMNFVRSKLDGEAQRWWDALPVNDPAIGAPWTFPNKVAVLRNHFRSLQAPHIYAAKLIERGMLPGETVREYSDAITQLGRKVDVQISDRELATAFVRGLPPELKSEVLKENPNATFNDLVRKAMGVEAANVVTRMPGTYAGGLRSYVDPAVDALRSELKQMRDQMYNLTTKMENPSQILVQTTPQGGGGGFWNNRRRGRGRERGRRR